MSEDKKEKPKVTKRDIAQALQELGALERVVLNRSLREELKMEKPNTDRDDKSRGI